MKQTLFEAEAVISVNTDKMFSDLDKAAREAKKRLQDALGGLSVPTLGGGRGGSAGGRGGGSYTDKMFGENMKYARLEKSVGQYSQAISRLTNLMNSYKLSAMQATEAETLLERIQAKRNQLQGKIQKQADKEYQRSQKNQTSPTGAYGATSSATDAMFKQEMSLYRAEKAAKQYGDAIARLTALTNNNKISTTQNAQAQAALTNTLRAQGKADIKAAAMGGAGGRGSGGVTPDLRRRNAQIQNASFAVQDFITVLSMGGGWSRAMASASNNLAFMTSMTGTLGGALAGLGITLAAVIVPALYNAAMGFEDFSLGAERAKKRVDSLRDSIESAASQMEVYQAAQEMGAPVGGNLGGLYERIKDTQKRLDVAKVRYKESTEGEDVGQARAGAVDDFYKRLGYIAGGIFQKMVGEDFRNEIMRGNITATDVRDLSKSTGFADNFLFGTTNSLEGLASAIDEANAPSKEAAKAIGELNKELYILRQRAGREAALDWAMTELGGYSQPGLVGRQQGPIAPGAKEPPAREEQRENIKEKQRAEKEQLQKELKAQSSLYETLFPKEAQAEEIRKQWDDAFGWLTEDMKKVRDMQIAEVMKPKRSSISGVMGGSELAGQLTNQLLQKQDPLNKIAEFASKQTGLQERIAQAVEWTEKKLEKLESNTFSSN